MEFVNRKRELDLLDAAYRKHGMVVVWGRRRIGKSKLITYWLEKGKKRGCRIQVIQGSSKAQISSLYEDIKEYLPTQIEPENWAQFFQLVQQIEGTFVLAIDEFPYLVDSDPSIPSVFQKWIDNPKRKANLQLILLGSSQHMMHNLFLNRTSPLFGRAYREIHIQPIDYFNFCKYLGLDFGQRAFEFYALVGGIPKYWDYIDKKQSLEKNIEALFFDYAAFFENEPAKLLKDEGVDGLIPLSILEAIGRGAHKPSEIASRLGKVQSSLTRTFNALIDGSFIEREICFGDSPKNAKKVLYQISDYALRFWYEIYSPYQSRWDRLESNFKKEITHLFFSRVFEKFVRSQFASSQRYWDQRKNQGIEFDCVFIDDNGILQVKEIKFKSLNENQRQKILQELQSTWYRSQLAREHKKVNFEVIELDFLKKEI
jgi:AAA+ ATPase superfamily predicted ATPase